MTRLPLRLEPDPRRVVARLFLPGQEMMGNGESRAGDVIGRILELSDDDVARAVDDVLTRFGDRHRDFRATLDAHFDVVAHRIGGEVALSPERRLLIGAFFTNEYSVEAAALCNPSIVLAPDQDGVGPGQARFVMSLRAIGEGHISSIEFRTGVVDAGGEVSLDDPGPYLVPGRPGPPLSEANVFGPKLDLFSYATDFPAASLIGERVLLPIGQSESNGMEDARFVRFTDDDGGVTYYATYTAFDGVHVAPQLLQTDDFRHFRVTQLTGAAAKNKGLALFPRRIGGRYFALSRWDRECNSLAVSDDCRSWTAASTIQSPELPWELLQLGNCGSPIETPEGWLVLTHGVGPMRVYSIGAVLLDLDDPARLRARLSAPLMEPDAGERDGYVPNVLYSCGALLHGDSLVIPYGISDAKIGMATVDLGELLGRLLAPNSSGGPR